MVVHSRNDFVLRLTIDLELVYLLPPYSLHNSSEETEVLLTQYASCQEAMWVE